LVARRRSASRTSGGAWRRAAFLLLYAVPFSLAYVGLDTGTGALLLFGSVQLTILGVGWVRGERPHPIEWLALAGAASGVVYLVFPGVSAPAPGVASLMVLAGVGWGLYTLAGQGAVDPTAMTASAFARATLLVIPLVALGFRHLSVTAEGLFVAALSGGLTSGIGYAIWYSALRELTATRAALVQLSVPVLAGIGGVAFLGEQLTPRLLLASAMILGSIAIGVQAKAARVRQAGTSTPRDG